MIRYVVKDDPLGEEESVGQDRDVIFAAGCLSRLRCSSQFPAGAIEPAQTEIAISTTSSCS